MIDPCDTVAPASERGTWRRREARIAAPTPPERRLRILPMELKAMAASATLSVLLTACAPGPSRATLAPDSLRVRRDIEYLASDRLEGRGTGTPGQDSAAAYAARRYAALGLKSWDPGYLQHYVARSAMLAHNGAPSELATQNVVAYVPGTDARFRGEAIVIGAHLDHLGRSTIGALDPEAKDAIRNGADDNASGSAAVLELARLM